jgi:hypothetical protein
VRKVKDVQSVNRKMSQSPTLVRRVACIISLKTALKPVVCEHKVLDNVSVWHIIIFTLNYAQSGTDQTILPASTRYAECAPAGRQARHLPGQRLLRSGRSAAGEVRDASAGRDRQEARQRGGESVRLLATVLLPGAGSLSARRTCWPVTAETRTAIRAQTDTRADGFRCSTPRGRPGHFQFSSGRTNRRTLWRLGPPAQHRPPGAASKKTPVSTELDAVVGNDRRLVAAYEELRSRAVERLHHRGPGIAILMTRGFRCWMEACGQLLGSPSGTGPQTCLESCSLVGLRGEVVVLLASILLRRASKGMA